MEAWRAVEAAEHQGAMVALFIDEPTARLLAVDGGEDPGDLHITLAILGDDAAALDTTADAVTEALASVAAGTAPLTGTVSGWGRFTGSDGTDAVWVAPDVVGLDELRRSVVDALEAAGIPVDDTHGFNPHITVAYIDAGDDAPIDSAPAADLALGELTVAWADARTTTPLGGDPVTTTKNRTSEAFPGDRTYGDVRELLEKALTEKFGGEDTWIWVRDLTDTECIYTVEKNQDMGTYTAGFTIGDDGAVTLAEPVEVEARTTYEPVAGTAAAAPAPAASAPERAEAVTEARQHVVGRVLESKGTDDEGGRVFRVQILEYGDSRNGNRYTESVMAAAVPLYEGAKAYDHHRSEAELASSTIAGLVGGYRNVEATRTALEADLHLLPSAVHTAEALDASIEAQTAGLPPLVGLSHDVAMASRRVVEGGRPIKEVTAVRSVFSVDVVADPSAGGRATRIVEGGLLGTDLPEETDMTTLADMIASASDEDKAAFAALLTGAPASTETTETATESTVRYTPGSAMGALLIKTAIAGAGVDERLTESITAQLGDRFTEAELLAGIETTKRFGESFELAGLAPRVGHVSVGAEDREKKIERLDRALEGASGGYPSIKQAYVDITGITGLDALDAELAMVIMRESAMGARVEGMRSTESVNTGTWGEIFGDALHRRLTAEYTGNDFQAWRDLVSTISPRMDFRTNHIVRMGGYGVLPTVAQGDPYTALTSPTDEEATYAIAKKGGTEDLTMEAVANDDLGAIRKIPKKLARAAALTLYRFVVDSLMQSNPTIYDGVALFHASHSNTTATLPLDRAGLAAVKTKMRKQAAYGVAADVLGITPKFLWVPADLEQTAFELCTSTVAVTVDGNATIPNFHQGMVPRVIDHWTDTNDWFVTADPSSIETIEIGFFNGKQDPELFVQDDPKTGAVFTNDKITYKIRHIYGAAVAEYRGFQRATNA